MGMPSGQPPADGTTRRPRFAPPSAGTVVLVVMVSQSHDMKVWPPSNGGTSHLCEMLLQWKSMGVKVGVWGDGRLEVLRRLAASDIPVLSRRREALAFILRATNETFAVEPQRGTPGVALGTRHLGSSRGGAWVIAASPYPRDLSGGVMLARRANRFTQTRTIVYLHHFVKAPSAHYKSRGGLFRTTRAWAYQLLVLCVAKLTGTTGAVNETVVSDPVTSRWRLSILPIRACLSTSLVSRTPMEVDHVYDACYFGRMDPQKGIADILDIWSRVCKDMPHARIALIGPAGSMDPMIRRFVAESGLERNVIRLIPGPDQSHWTLVASSRLLLFPSYEEGWSLSVMEAAWLGLGVVAYDLDAYSYLKPAMRTCPVGNRSCMAATILDLLRDAESLRHLTAVARDRVSQYLPKEVARAELESLLRLGAVNQAT
jgi:glycosyltransferase involved in cell wall biosynthesis